MQEILHHGIPAGGPAKCSRVHLLQALAELPGAWDLVLRHQFVHFAHQHPAQVGESRVAEAHPTLE